MVVQPEREVLAPNPPAGIVDLEAGDRVPYEPVSPCESVGEGHSGRVWMGKLEEQIDVQLRVEEVAHLLPICIGHFLSCCVALPDQSGHHPSMQFPDLGQPGNKDKPFLAKQEGLRQTYQQ